MAKNRITLDVLADLTRKVGSGNNIRPSSKESKNNLRNKREEVLLVFTGSNINLNEKIRELKNLDVDYSLAFSFMAEKILDIEEIQRSLNPINVYREEDILNLEILAEKYSYIIGPNITINTLSKVSLGLIDSFISNIIWTFLYRSKKVFLDFMSVNNYLGSNTRNRKINSIINNYVSTVRDMGVIEIVDGEYLDKIVDNKEDYKNYNTRFLNKNTTTNSNIRLSNNVKINRELKANNHKREDYNHNNKVSDKTPKIITENDFISNYSDQKSVSFPKGTIITPLARDKARELRIQVNIDR